MLGLLVVVLFSTEKLSSELLGRVKKAELFVD